MAGTGGGRERGGGGFDGVAKRQGKLGRYSGTRFLDKKKMKKNNNRLLRF